MRCSDRFQRRRRQRRRHHVFAAFIGEGSVVSYRSIGEESADLSAIRPPMVSGKRTDADHNTHTYISGGQSVIVGVLYAVTRSIVRRVDRVGWSDKSSVVIVLDVLVDETIEQLCIS